MKEPESIWIIFDPLDGPHLFVSKTQAWKQYTRWMDEADQWDSVWDMSEPTEYRKVS